MKYKYYMIFILIFAHTMICHGEEKTLNLLNLDDAIQIASENSPEIREARLRFDRNQYLLNAKQAALKSQFSLQLTPYSFSRDRTYNTLFSLWNTNELQESSAMFMINQPILWTDGTIQLINRFSYQEAQSEFSGQDERDKSFNNNLYLSYNQPIFTYNRTKLELKELKLNLENAALQYALQNLSLTKSVSQYFYNVYLNKMRVEIATEEVMNRKASHDIIKNKVEAGIAPMEELYQAELDLATSKSSLQNTTVLLENSLDNLKLLIGMPLDQEISVIEDISDEKVKIDLGKAISHGKEHRLEIRQREIDIETSTFNLIEVASQNEFVGNLNISYGIIGTDEELRDVYNESTENQDISISFQVPLWDWGERKSRIAASELDIKSSELMKEDELNSILIGIRQAFRQVKNQETQIEIARQNIKNAQLTYEINLERYKNGDLTSMDLNLFENQLSEKKISLVEALINYKMELLNLKIQSLYDFEKNEPAIPSIEID